MPHPLDDAYDILAQLQGELAAFDEGAGPLSESDTRVKLIDPLFVRALRWPERHIRREMHTADGFVDYVFSDPSHTPTFLLEAKRLEPRFRLPRASPHRSARIDGPVLADKAVQSAVTQAARYSQDEGISFAVVANGRQLVVFQPLVRGIPWRKATAEIFYDIFSPVEFARLYDLLEFNNVISGSLQRAFAAHATRRGPRYIPLDRIPNPDRELSRNDLWPILGRLASIILDDSPESREDVSRNCYVTTQGTEETDSVLRRLLTDAPPPLAVKMGTAHLRKGQGGYTALDHALEAASKTGTSGLYVLIGGVGSGKTTYLSRFETVIAPSLVRAHCAWFHADYLASPKSDPNQINESVATFAYSALRDQISARYGDQVPATAEDLRDLFRSRIVDLEKTRLYGLADDSPERLAITNAAVDVWYQDSKTFVTAALSRLRKSGRSLIIILDNTDQLGDDFQEAVFFLAQSMETVHGAVTIVSLREEKFYAAYQRGVFNAYSTRKFHIGSPRLVDVLRSRIDYGLRLLIETPDLVLPGVSQQQLQECCDLLRVLLKSITERNRNIVRLLEAVSSGNIRFALELFRDFAASRNTDIDKIVRIWRQTGGYTLPFHEFAKSVMLKDRQLYRSSRSVIMNVFALSPAVTPSHMTALRILFTLFEQRESTSSHGPGFVSVDRITSAFRESFRSIDDLAERMQELVQRNLVESEPPKMATFSDAEAFKIGAGGAYYLQYLTRSFVYLDLVVLDTPLSDDRLAGRVADSALEKDLELRIARVLAFLEYLGTEEESEIATAQGTAFSGVYLIPAIREQIVREVTEIRRKAKRYT